MIGMLKVNKKSHMKNACLQSLPGGAALGDALRAGQINHVQVADQHAIVATVSLRECTARVRVCEQCRLRDMVGVSEREETQVGMQNTR